MQLLMMLINTLCGYWNFLVNMDILHTYMYTLMKLSTYTHRTINVKNLQQCNLINTCIKLMLSRKEATHKCISCMYGIINSEMCCYH